MMCKFGANPNLTHNDNYPVLVLALMNGQTLDGDTMTDLVLADVMECLLKAGADVNILTNRGSPFHLLFQKLVFEPFNLKRSSDWVFLLAKYGARYDLPCFKNRTLKQSLLVKHNFYFRVNEPEKKTIFKLL